MSLPIDDTVVVHAEFLSLMGDDSETEVPLVHRHIVRVQVTEATDTPAGDRIIIHTPDRMLGGFVLVPSNGTTTCFYL